MDSFPTTYWSYVPSSDNPADLLTRGLSAQQPTWLPSKTQWLTWSPKKVLLLQTDEATDTTTSQDNPAQIATPQEFGIHSIIPTQQTPHHYCICPLFLC